MIEFMFVSMLQAATGEPQIAAPTPDAAVTEAIPESVRARRERHRIRCRDQVNVGSRLGNRVCISRADEEDMTEASRGIADEMHRGGALNGDFGPGQLGPCQGRNC